MALFREPAPRRWRYVFDLEELKSDDQQFVVGAHACAFSVASGTPVGIEREVAELILKKGYRLMMVGRPVQAGESAPRKEDVR